MLYLKKLFPLSPFLFCLLGCAPQSNLIDFNREKAALARVELAFAYLSVNELNIAREHLAIAKQHKADHPKVLWALARYEFLKENNIQSEKYFRQLFSLNKEDSDHHLILFDYVLLLCKMEEFTRAEQQFINLLNQNHYEITDELIEKAKDCLSSGREGLDSANDT